MFNLRSKVFTGTESGGWKIWKSYASNYIYQKMKCTCAYNNENLLSNVLN